MTLIAPDAGATAAQPESEVRLRELPIKGTYSSAEKPLTAFYVPALSVSCRYDRMAGYYSSSVLRTAAVGVRRFIDNARSNDGRMRLIVGAQLSPQDVEAVRSGTRSREDALRAAVMSKPLTDVEHPDGLGDEYVHMLSWMVREELLQIKVGIPVDRSGNPLTPDEADGYFHSKYGVLADATGDRLAFIGSGNETAAGWLRNHETFSVAKSWLTQVWDELGEDIVTRFENHWTDSPDVGWWVTDLAAVDDRLLTLASPDYVLPGYEPILGPSPNGHAVATDDSTDEAVPGLSDEAALAELEEIRQAPRLHPFTGALTAPAEPLPHQSRLLERAVDTYPRGYLFADPVGFGKTLEVGFTVRELILSGRASTALILTPASVLRQWQEELSEKLGLLVPRYEAGSFVDVYGETVVQPANTKPWSAFPIVLASSHLARRKERRAEILAAGPWDIVVVDEAHHARRRGSKSNDTPNSLLTLLMEMRQAHSWKALYLATATPMQMHAHEVWDLLALFHLPGRWGGSALDFQEYYANLNIDPENRDWALLSAMIHDYFSDDRASKDKVLEADIRGRLGAVKAKKIVRMGSSDNLLGMPAETAAKLSDEEALLMERWLRRHTPMRDRAFRNTRDTLRRYQEAGIIAADVNIPERHVADEFIDLNPIWERPLYDRIEQYITRYYNAYMTGGAKALGFIMTIYRRRLTSSFYAIRRSLERRLEALERGESLQTLLTADDMATVEGSLFEMDDLEVALNLLNNEITELRSFVHELQALSGQDTKATQLIGDLEEAFKTFDSVVVFTQYTDTMDYVRRRLVRAGHLSVGCYSGRGGEIWNQDTEKWDAVTKAYLKNRFRDGKVKVLVGTDSMSEGLNLQTCSRLINYDMPWNLMRVEQRIGRVDRIGAARPYVQITNYFYSDTVEEAVYKGIREGYDDFTAIIGSAQPVLGAIEKTIEQLALSNRPTSVPPNVHDEIEKIRGGIAEAQGAAVHLDDLTTAATLDVSDVSPAITVEQLEQRLTRNLITGPKLAPSLAMPGVYEIDDAVSRFAGGKFPTVNGRVVATFDRALADEQGIPLLSYGHPLFDALLKPTTASEYPHDD